ncbi:hypothetical protein BDW02DRAFT_628445 [Decorospora gaudefroyi]|uniref:Uncharacterized protein n=1 Tax=Decorospora gaudefroyi TaxID=184978 RepID=A0A6A5KM64_9PLEO|nr:hypothetical protein BDW02DRAFT_628445 [Decorospora gaudefroyi]
MLELCTAFAIAANQSSQIGGSYSEYKGKHRNAIKLDVTNGSAVVIDSGRGAALQLEAGERSGDWHNTAGKVSWREMTPVEVAFHEDAMRLCLDQMFRRRRYVLIFHRDLVVDDRGEFGSLTVFLGFHRAFRLQQPALDNCISFWYVCPGGGSYKELHECNKAVTGHLYSLRSLGEVRERLTSEVDEIFAQATNLWRYPRVPFAETSIDNGKVLREWPVPRFEEVQPWIE